MLAREWTTAAVWAALLTSLAVGLPKQDSNDDDEDNDEAQAGKGQDSFHVRKLLMPT